MIMSGARDLISSEISSTARSFLYTRMIEIQAIDVNRRLPIVICRQHFKPGILKSEAHATAACKKVN